MGIMNRKFTSEDIKKAQADMIACPFCGSNKVKLTTVSKGADKGDKVQGMCNVCYGRGPAVADDPYKAVELWNKRLLYDSSEVDSIELDAEQMRQFLNGDILLNTKTQLEFNSVLYYCEGKLENCSPETWKHNWGKYKENTVISARSSIVDEEKPMLGYCDKEWYKKNYKIPIETLKVTNKKPKSNIKL